MKTIHFFEGRSANYKDQSLRTPWIDFVEPIQSLRELSMSQYFSSGKTTIKETFSQLQIFCKRVSKTKEQLTKVLMRCSNLTANID